MTKDLSILKENMILLLEEIIKLGELKIVNKVLIVSGKLDVNDPIRTVDNNNYEDHSALIDNNNDNDYKNSNNSKNNHHSNCNNDDNDNNNDDDNNNNNSHDNADKQSISGIVDNNKSLLPSIMNTDDALAALASEFTQMGTISSTVLSSEKLDGVGPRAGPIAVELQSLLKDKEEDADMKLNENADTKSAVLAEYTEIKSREISTKVVDKPLKIVDQSPEVVDQSPVESIEHNQSNKLPCEINQFDLADIDSILSQSLIDLETSCEKAISKLSDFVILDALYSRSMKLNFEECHPVIFFHELTKKFEILATKKYITLGMKSNDKFDNNFILADPIKLCKAFENLIVNAVEHTPKYGIIQVIKS